MRIAIINITGGGMSGGYRKYLRNVLPQSLTLFFSKYPTSLHLFDGIGSLPSAKFDNLFEFIENPPYIENQPLRQWLYQF